MDAQTLLLESLDSRWGQYRADLKTCRSTLSEESVHDLRVATRRLLALAELLRAVMPHPGTKKLLIALKAQLDRLDQLRDTQVLRIEISQNPDWQPELEPFRQHLERRECRLLRKAGQLIGTRRLGGLARRVRKVRERLEQQEPGLGERTLQAVDKTYLSAISRYRRIDPARPDTIHHVRIAFKHLRYTLETLYPLLGTFPEANLARMQAYQTQMGDIQNAEVFRRALARFGARKNRKVPRTLLRYCQQCRTRLIAAYMKNKGEIVTFWRPAPDQPFPWEEPHEPVHRPPRHR